MPGRNRVREPTTAPTRTAFASQSTDPARTASAGGRIGAGKALRTEGKQGGETASGSALGCGRGLRRFRREAREIGERAAGRAIQAQPGGAGAGDEPAATVEVGIGGDLADDEPA